MLIKGISADLKNNEIYFKGSKICAFLNTLYASAPAQPSSVVNSVNKLDFYLKELELSTVTSTMLPLFKGCPSL